MGRLYWKFFAFFVLAQVTTVVVLSFAFWVRHRAGTEAADHEPPGPPAAAAMLDRAAATLERDGEPGLRALLDAWAGSPLPVVLAVDPTGRELLGRATPPPAADGPEARPRPDATRRVTLGDGRSYVLIAAPPSVDGPPGPGRPARGPGAGLPDGGRGPGGGRPDRSAFPLEPLIGGVVASFLFAALLAWYVAKPIRRLRAAFEAAGQGQLDVRIGESMGRRRDELADLGRAFDRSALRLQNLVDGQRRLLHDVSHELRSPLARMQAAIGLARQQPEHAEASLQRIERESERMDRLIDELLTLSRAEAGIGGEQDDEVSPAELVTGIVDDAAFEAQAASRPVAFARDLAALDGVVVRGNAEMLHRALDNVVRNAVRFTPPGGTIAIAGTRDAPHRQLVLTVCDEGPGVPEGELEAIFAPFFRSASAGPPTGHGLGLAIARRLIAMHGGSIRASNRRPTGLCVEIRIPG